LRVFVSHTSELRAIPAERSYVAAAEEAVTRAGHAVAGMTWFSARSASPADYSREMVARADVYVGVIGQRYGSTVPDHPDQSYVEMEFETATALGLPRLIFLVGPYGDGRIDARRQEFRRRLRRDGHLTFATVTSATVTSPDQLVVRLLQSLVELKGRARRAARAAGRGHTGGQGRVGRGARRPNLAERGDAGRQSKR
jgi:hypothetical protein